MCIVNSSLVLKTLPHVGHVNFLEPGVLSGEGDGGCPGGGIGGGATVPSLGSFGFLL